MSTGRADFRMVLLADGRVLATGGWTGAGVTTLATAEVYTPDAGTWTNAASMGTPRFGHGAVLLPSGKVLVAGGVDQTTTATTLRSAELFDPLRRSGDLTRVCSRKVNTHTA